MPSPEAIRVARIISRLLGWTYTTAWSLSFYPQPVLNLRRRSTTGTTPAFPFINTLGFLSYFLSTLTFYASPLIRAQYAARNPTAPTPTVRLNDLVFTIHAVVMSTLTWTMFAPRVWGFTQGKNERVGRTMWGIAAGCLLSIVCLVMYVGLGSKKKGYDAQHSWAWIDVVYGVSYIKLFITCVKYIPQVYTNWRCGSTVGWSVGQNVLDLMGAVLSVAQLVIDSFVEEGGGGWSGVLGNPVKFALGNVTVVFDLIFVLQHYVWFRGARGEEGGGGKELDGGEDGERRRLLDGNGREGDGR